MTERDNVESLQHRCLVDLKGQRVNAFGKSLSYGMDTMKVAYKRHEELGTHPVIQRRAVRVTMEYGDWEDVPYDPSRESVSTDD